MFTPRLYVWILCRGHSDVGLDQGQILAFTCRDQIFKDIQISPIFKLSTVEARICTSFASAIYITHHSLLSRIDILELSTHSNLVVPNLAESLITVHVTIIVPAVRIQTNTELENTVVVDRRRSIQPLDNLVSIKPNLEEARVVTSPLDLQDDPVPLSSTDLAKVSQSVNGSTAVRLAVVSGDDSREELVPLNPNHGTGHPVVSAASRSRTIGNELGNVVGLRLEVPCVGEAERETVKGRVAALVAVVVVDLGVVAVMVVGVVGLGHLERRAALVGDIGDLVDCSLVLLADVVPAAEGAGVVEGSGGEGAGRGDECQGGGEDGFEGNHDGRRCLGCWLGWMVKMVDLGVER